jgi:hypothetical protein
MPRIGFLELGFLEIGFLELGFLGGGLLETGRLEVPLPPCPGARQGCELNRVKEGGWIGMDAEDHDDHGGRTISQATWIVDYAGDGKYCVRRIAHDGSFDGFVELKHGGFFGHLQPEFGASAHAWIYAIEGDTVVFTPLFALIHSLGSKNSMKEIAEHQPKRMPRRKHFPRPMWFTQDGIGIIKGSMHADQSGAFTSALAVNGFNMGLNGCNCAGTKRRWEWVGPRGRDETTEEGGGEVGEN